MTAKQTLQRIKNIPNEIFSLLWFANGEYENYHPKADQIESYICEPSLIDVTAEVSMPTSAVPPLDYSPSYENLLPEQRYKYLTWLTDISQSIDIGYAFIFHYGLVRHIMYGDDEKAFKVMAKLLICHENRSFRSYSTNAMFVFMMKHKRWDLLHKIDLDYIGDVRLALLISVLVSKHLSAKVILRAHKLFGFSNRKYIKSHPEIFEAELQAEIINRYGEDRCPVYEQVSNIDDKFCILLSNRSLNANDRTHWVPNVAELPILKSEVPALLKIAHENTKRKLSAR